MRSPPTTQLFDASALSGRPPNVPLNASNDAVNAPASTPRSPSHHGSTAGTRSVNANSRPISSADSASRRIHAASSWDRFSLRSHDIMNSTA